MARSSKLEVGAINIRIADEKNRDYAALVAKIAALKSGVRVYGDTYLAISTFRSSRNWGVLSKYTEIDLDGDWFDIDDFGIATDEKVEQVNIPESLRPNLSQFYFKLNSDLHVIAFEAYSHSKGLSARSVENYFRTVLSHPDVVAEFGTVEADVIKNYGEVERLLSLNDLKELKIIVRRPNSDDAAGEDLAQIIEERMREQNAREYQETTKSSPGQSLEPSTRTRALATLAADNGEVQVASLINGVLVRQDTERSPLLEVATVGPDDDDYPLFEKLAEQLYGRITEARESRRAK